MAYFAASSDDPETNQKFAESLDLDFPILSDPGLEVARSYGVISGESKYCARHTIYIGKDGKVLHVDREVNPGNAGADVASRLESLGVPRGE